LNRIRSVHHDDRDRRRRSLGGKGSRRVGLDDHVNLEAHKFGSEVTKPLRLPFCIAPRNGKVQPLHIPHVAQALPQEFRGTDPQNTDSEHLRRLLPLGGERRGKEHRACASEERAAVDQWVRS
jgi:hypothetical protein